MRAHVDESLCIGCAMCASMCEDVYSMNEDGISVAIDSEIPESLLSDAEDAKDACPVDAIIIE